MISEVGLLFAGRAGLNAKLPEPSGGDNGCEGALGKACTKNFKEAVKNAMVNGSSLDSAARNFRLEVGAPTATNLSCPADLFEYFDVKGSTTILSIIILFPSNPSVS